LLYQIRIDSYGPELTFNHECPKCNKTSGYKIDLNEIVADGTIKIHPYREPLRVELPRSGGYAVIRHMTGRDEKNLTQLANSNNRALNAATLLRIAELNGKEPSPQEWLELIGEDRAIIRGAIEAMNKAGLDMELELTCLECGSDYKIALSAVPDFFVPSKTNTERYME
jgi:hypothetical protein